MSTEELVAMLEGCHTALEKMGVYGGYIFGQKEQHGADMAFQVKKEDLPEGGKVWYNTSMYDDFVIKNVVFGNVAFFTFLTEKEAEEDGAFDNNAQTTPPCDI